MFVLFFLLFTSTSRLLLLIFFHSLRVFSAGGYSFNQEWGQFGKRVSSSDLITINFENSIHFLNWIQRDFGFFFFLCSCVSSNVEWYILLISKESQRNICKITILILTKKHYKTSLPKEFEERCNVQCVWVCHLGSSLFVTPSNSPNEYDYGGITLNWLLELSPFSLPLTGFLFVFLMCWFFWVFLLVLSFTTNHRN